MNVRQGERAAKYCYDLSKIVVTVAVVMNALSERFQPLNFWLGMGVGVVFYVAGYLLDGVED